MPLKSKTSTERRHGTPDGAGSGKDLGNFTGFAHSKISAHFHAARAAYSTTTYDPIDDRVKISIAGDWGTGTDEARIVAAAMENSDPDFTIHLGDVYYAGECSLAVSGREFRT